MWTVTILIILSLSLGIAAWLFFLWSVKSGQYDDVERPKHRMLDDDFEKAGQDVQKSSSDGSSDSKNP